MPSNIADIAAWPQRPPVVGAPLKWVPVQQWRLSLQSIVVRDHDPRESGTSGANPFPALHHREPAVLLEGVTYPFWREDQNFSHERGGQLVNPARSVPCASGAYQIWFSMSQKRSSGNS
jgi:hypothetical protein